MAINRTKSRRQGALLTIAFCVAGLLSVSLQAADQAPASSDGQLPVLSDPKTESNPYRDRADIATIGREIFNHNCSRCHGVDAVASGTGAMPAPDLRRLGSYCRRLADETFKTTCRNDTDAYFLKSALKGKTIVGVEHMPAWENILSRESLWAIRTYLESRGNKPR